MSPTIPSPTPITGVKTTGGRPSLRLPIDVFQEQYPFAFALYVQALAAWQKDGNEQIDQDNAKGTGYFQVVGVHGVPYVPWQKDPTAAASDDPSVGYCTHRSVLFIPWHRPYLMLYEQIIFAYAQEIANNATGYAAKAYGDALGNVRLPYWDWASDPHLPKVVMSPEITLTIPGQKEHTTDTLTLAHNPLYSYRFTSDSAIELMQGELRWHHTDAWAESKRCPEEDGRSNQAVSDKQVGTFTEFKEATFKAITQVTDFDQFTTQAWRENQGPHNYSSIEDMHNNIHNYVGTNDSVLKKLQHNIPTSRTGNMTDVQASSFDPIFWLHHVNCDRLAALWQALNPGAVIQEWKSLMGRFTADAETMEGGKSRLEPWHRSSDHSDQDYWIANDTKDLISTFDGGYYYPETPLELLRDPAKMKAYTLKQIYSLYTPQSLRKGPPAQSTTQGQAPIFQALFSGSQKEQDQQQPQKPLDAAPAQSVSAPQQQQHGQAHDDLIRNQPISHWQAFLRVRNFALTGTWAVHIFLGEPPADSTDWFLAAERVGSVSMLSNRSRAQCPNCVAHAEGGQHVTGTVPLTEALQARGIDVNDREAVKQYLESNLHWRVAKDTEEVPITDELDLTVGVSRQEVTLPHGNDELPTWGECDVVSEITARKEGGLNEDNRLSLGV